ncbi:MAG TPA: EamA family transporter RarD [Steroidobacteraceae bacterium]
MRDTSRGYVAALAAFVFWGFLPLYFMPLHDVPAVQVVAHRVVWSFALVLGAMALRGELGEIRATLVDSGVLVRLLGSAAFISINWIMYVWAIAHGHVVDASLGYFITPLVNVLMAVVVLSERLNRLQWTAVALAALGVTYLTLETGELPWICLTLGFSFATYGLIRKIVHVEALAGLATETLLLMPLALGYLIWCEAAGSAALGHASLEIDALLIGSGPVTATTLFLFAYSARRIPLSTLGVLNYIAPTLQLACGVFIFHEPFGRAHAIGFALIWTALLLYAGDGLWRARPQT